MSEIKLPPMPEPSILGSSRFGSLFKGYVAMHMQNYARAAIELDRQGRGEPVGMTSIADMCRILKEHYVEEAERTDCTILYTVTFDQLRAIYDRGRREGPQPANPAIKESLTVAEPVKVVSETEALKIIGYYADLRIMASQGRVSRLEVHDAWEEIKALLARYGSKS